MDEMDVVEDELTLTKMSCAVKILPSPNTIEEKACIVLVNHVAIETHMNIKSRS